jgi:hypothetical protein
MHATNACLLSQKYVYLPLVQLIFRYEIHGNSKNEGKYE